MVMIMGRRVGRRQSKPSGSTEGHNFGVGEQVIRGPKPDSRDRVLGERAASPSPSAVSSPRGVRTPLGELTAQATDGFSCNVPPDCLSWHLGLLFLYLQVVTVC